jgi:hypothetical protein
LTNRCLSVRFRGILRYSQYVLLGVLWSAEEYCDGTYRRMCPSTSAGRRVPIAAKNGPNSSAVTKNGHSCACANDAAVQS